MTDTTTAQPQKGYTKAGMTGLLVAAATQVHPLVVASIVSHYPIVGNDLANLLVASAESFIGGTVTQLTPHSIVQAVTDAILFCKGAIAQWRAAWNSKGN